MVVQGGFFRSRAGGGAAARALAAGDRGADRLGIATGVPETLAGLEIAQLEQRYQDLRREYDARFRR
jgi:hypothetical protein